MQVIDFMNFSQAVENTARSGGGSVKLSDYAVTENTEKQEEEKPKNE